MLTTALQNIQYSGFLVSRCSFSPTGGDVGRFLKKNFPSSHQVALSPLGSDAQSAFGGYMIMCLTRIRSLCPELYLEWEKDFFLFSSCL